VRQGEEVRADGRVGVQVSPELIEDLADVVGEDCLSFTRR
jgi:hypothetical protein